MNPAPIIMKKCEQYSSAIIEQMNIAKKEFRPMSFGSFTTAIIEAMLFLLEDEQKEFAIKQIYKNYGHLMES